MNGVSPGSVAPPEITIRSSDYFVARTLGKCWHCEAATLLVALALPPGHESLEPDDERRARDCLDTWILRSHGAFLFYVDYLSDAVLQRLTRVSPFYRFAGSGVDAPFYWANHCEQCGTLLDDHELFCEPEGAFSPTSEADAGLIRLIPMHTIFEAAAAGYAPDPAFFDAMSRDR